MLNRFDVFRAPYLPGPVDTWPRSQQHVVGEFLTRGLIEPADWGFKTTAAGRRVVKKTRLAFEFLMMDTDQ
ncbi:hypothetical protein D3C78_1839760 [compost metagenome]